MVIFIKKNIESLIFPLFTLLVSIIHPLKFQSNNKITQLNQKSNTSTQNNSDHTIDVDYLSAVERGDMETAQRMVDEAQLKKAATGNACDSFCNYSAILISTGNQINLLR